MKILLAILTLFVSTTTMAQDHKAHTIKKTFSRTTEISTNIQSDASTVWSLLTDASNFPAWNSTVISIDGKIETGEKIRLKSTLDPKRTFKLKVKEMTPNRKLVWGDAMGKRTYTINETSNGIKFTMSEKIGSFMFPLFANKIPSFDESFEQFASDLKAKAEALTKK